MLINQGNHDKKINKNLTNSYLNLFVFYNSRKHFQVTTTFWKANFSFRLNPWNCLRLFSSPLSDLLHTESPRGAAAFIFIMQY